MSDENRTSIVKQFFPNLASPDARAVSDDELELVAAQIWPAAASIPRGEAGKLEYVVKNCQKLKIRGSFHDNFELTGS